MPAPPSSPPRCLVGGAEVVMLEDAAGTFFAPRAAAFPAATPDQWAAADSLDPEAVTADGQWLLRFRCFAVRLPGGRVILVDTGVGPAGATAASWASVPGRLPQALAEAGIAVLVSATMDQVLISGDLLVHAVQLLHPGLGYAYETDQDAARASRVALLDQLNRAGGLLATSHLGRPFLPVCPPRPAHT